MRKIENESEKNEECQGEFKGFWSMVITAVAIMDSLATMDSMDIMDFPDSLNHIGSIEIDLIMREVSHMGKKVE